MNRSRVRPGAVGLLCVSLAFGVGCSATRTDPIPAVDTPLDSAYYVGEVTPHSAILWARCQTAEEILVNVSPGPSGGRRAPVDRDRDRTARLPLLDLEPDTSYRYSLWCLGEGKRRPVSGTFRTAPEAEDRTAVRFAWFGDVGGQNVCRDREYGYIPFQQVWATHPDFMVALGDMIYGDDRCAETGRYGNAQIPGPGPATTVDDYHAHWRYARADPYLQRAYSAAAVYPIWDDHEIKNDAGPHHDSRSWRWWQHLMPAARQAFSDYNPMTVDAEPARLYRSVRWGHHLELFLLDTRSFRDANGAKDGADKTMLGAEQKRWLLDALQSSNATWKIIVSSVPMSIPTGDDSIGRDSWASGETRLGFENELREILATARGLTRRHVLFVTTDVHFGTAFRYVPFEEDPDFAVHEFVTGPINAGVFPRRDLDETFHPERLVFWGPESPDAISSYRDAMHWFNFGEIEIDEAGSLTARVRTADGTVAYELGLRP